MPKTSQSKSYAPVDSYDHYSPQTGIAAEVAQHPRHLTEHRVVFEELLTPPNPNLDHER